MSKTYINKQTAKDAKNVFVISHDTADLAAEVVVQANTNAAVYTGAEQAAAATVITGASSNAKIKTVAAGVNDVFVSNNVAFNNVTVGGDVFGGALALDAKGKVNKVGDGTVTASVENVALAFVGGKANRVYGGGAGYGSYVGNVDIAVNGGSMNQIYGGGADGAVVGNVNIEVGAGAVKWRNDRIGAIYGGGKNAVVEGDVQVTFAAGSAALYFTGTVSGTGTGKNGYVLGDSTLTFSDYAGKFSGSIKNFDTVQFVGSTQVALTKGQDKTLTGADYEFVLTDDSIGNSSAMLTWDKKFATGDVLVTIDSDSAETAELRGKGATITLISSKYFKTAADFDKTNLRVQNEYGELLAGYSYDIDYVYGKKGGSVSITYTGAALDLGSTDKTTNLNSANDYVNVLSGSKVTGAINMAGGNNKLVVQSNSELAGEVIFEAGSTNEVIVNGVISGAFDSQAGSTNVIKLNSAKVGSYQPTYMTGPSSTTPFPTEAFVSAVVDLGSGSGNDTVVLSGDTANIAGVNFGNGSDVLVLNSNFAGNVSWGRDGNDAVVANVDMDLTGNNFGLQGTNNALVVGNGRTVTVNSAWFGTGAFGTDSSAAISGVYLNDNAMLVMAGGKVIQNYTGDIMLDAGATLNVLAANGDAPEALKDYYTNSGTGVNGVVTGTGAGETVAFGKGSSSNVVAGGENFVLKGIENVTVASDTIAVISNTVNMLGDVSNAAITLGDDAQLIFTDKLVKYDAVVIGGAALDDKKEYAKFVLAQNLTKDVNFGDAAYQGAGNVYFQAASRIDANVSFNNQVAWLQGVTLALDATLTFAGNSAIGFNGGNNVWDWQDTTYDKTSAAVGFVGANGAVIRVDGDVWGQGEIDKIINQSALYGNSMLGISDVVYVQNWEGDYSDAANWIVTPIGAKTQVFDELVVMSDGIVKASNFVFGANSDSLLIGDNVEMRGANGAYDYITISGDADANMVLAGKSDIYGQLVLAAGNDMVVLNNTTFHDTINMPQTDVGFNQLATSIDLGAGSDLLVVSGGVTEGIVQFGIDGASDRLFVVGDVTVDENGVKTMTEDTYKATAFFGENLAIAVFDQGNLANLTANPILVNNLDNATATNTMFVGRGQVAFDANGEWQNDLLTDAMADVRTNGTVSANIVYSGAANNVYAGVVENINYNAAGINTEETIETVEIMDGFTATITGDSYLRNGSLKAAEPAGNNVAGYGVQVNTNGSYNALTTPDLHKQAEVDFLGTVTVNATGVTAMGDAYLERNATVYSSAAGALDDVAQNSKFANVAATNTFMTGYQLIADQEGVIKVGGNVDINVGSADKGAVSMTGVTNTYMQEIDIFAGEQALVEVAGKTVTDTVNGDVDMLAVAVGGNASNNATLGVWRYDFANTTDYVAAGNSAAATTQMTSVYGNQDMNTRFGSLGYVYDTTKTIAQNYAAAKAAAAADLAAGNLQVVLNGDLNMYGVNDDATGNTVDNNLRVLRYSTVNGNIALGEYYRDSWTNTNTMVVDNGAVISNQAVTMVGGTNTVNFYGVGGSTAQTFSMYGLQNTVNVGGTNAANVWSDDQDRIVNNITTYDAVIGNINSNNLFDMVEDTFATQDYLAGKVATADDYADLDVNVLGSKVDGNIVAYGTTTYKNVTGENVVAIASVPAHAASVTGNIELTTNDNNQVYVTGVAGARASVGGNIVANVDQVLGAGVNQVNVGLATTGNITTALKDANGVANNVLVGFDRFGTPIGDGVVGDVLMTALAAGTNTLLADVQFKNTYNAATKTPALDDARRANTIGNVTQTSVNGANQVSVVGDGIVLAFAPTVDVLTGKVTADNNVVTKVFSTIGNIAQTSVNGANVVNLTDANSGNITMKSTNGDNTLTVLGDKIYTVGQSGAELPQTFVTGIVGNVLMSTVTGNNAVTIGNAAGLYAKFASLEMQAATNAVTVNAGSEVTGALSFDDPSATAFNTANTVTVAGKVGSIASKADANDAITINAGAVVGNIDLGGVQVGGVDTITINAGVTSLGTLTNDGAMTITNNAADLDITANNVVLTGANVIGAANDLKGSGTITLDQVTGLTADVVSGFSGIEVDFSDEVASNVTGATTWDALTSVSNLSLALEAADWTATKAAAAFLTAGTAFTGTGSIALNLDDNTKVSLTWNATENAWIGTSTGKTWKITGKDTNTLALGVTVA